MSVGPQAHMLPDGRRLHLNHGPIDLIVEAWGQNRDACYAAAWARFQTVLTGLAAELPKLRRQNARAKDFADPIAKRMADRIAPFRNEFVTPMAAVAGAVADTILAEMVARHVVPKAYVNNGGDIAFHLAQGESFTGLGVNGHIELKATDAGRGIATSGWKGRSHSLGIADSVTVTANSAAQADVAATLIANAVDVPGHSAITREHASVLSPDSDLGDRLVTTHVGALSLEDVSHALDMGAQRAAEYRQRGLILNATLTLQGHSRLVGAPAQQQKTKDLIDA